MTKRHKSHHASAPPVPHDDGIEVLSDDDVDSLPDDDGGFLSAPTATHASHGTHGVQAELQHLRTLSKAELLQLKEAFARSRDAESFRPLAEAYLDLIRFLDTLVVGAGKGKGRHALTALHQLSNSTKGPGRWIISRLQEALGRGGNTVSGRTAMDPRLMNKLEETEKAVSKLRAEVASQAVQLAEAQERARAAEKERDGARKATERLAEQLMTRAQRK